MVLSLDRLLTSFALSRRCPAIARLDLGALSDHALKDLNLLPEFRVAEDRRSEVLRLTRW
jgi:uncharacterized protein YjiS (DUF1127 family)